MHSVMECLFFLSLRSLVLMFLEDLFLHQAPVHVIAVIFDLFVILTGQNGFFKIKDRLVIVLPKLFGHGIAAIDPGFIDRADSQTPVEMLPKLVEPLHVHQQRGDVKVRVGI